MFKTLLKTEFCVVSKQSLTSYLSEDFRNPEYFLSFPHIKILACKKVFKVAFHTMVVDLSDENSIVSSLQQSFIDY